jgi:transcriptional regulator with XRE-family HTH domain
MPLVAMRLDKALRALDLDIETLASLSRTRYAACYAYLQGSRIPNAFAALRIAQALKVDAADLFLEPATKEERSELAKRAKKGAA